MFEALAHVSYANSSLTAEEEITLFASYVCAFHKRFQCREQEEKIWSRFPGDEAEKRVTQLRAQKGCNGQVLDYKVCEFGRYVFHTCPCTFASPARFIPIYRAYAAFEQHGTLPYQGGVFDQPAKVFAAFAYLRAIDERHRPKAKD